MSYQLFAYYYDRLMQDMPYDKWLKFAEGCWDRYGKPASLVDLGCGTGNLAIPLAQSGIQVFAIDLSEDMLAVAQSKSDNDRLTQQFQGDNNRIKPQLQSDYDRLEHKNGLRTGGSILWLQQDICEWQLTEQVDAAVSFCDCFNYLLEEADIVQAFTQTYAGLKPGGLFVFDVHPQQQLVAYAESQPFFLDDEDAAYIWTCALDAEACEIEHELTIFIREPSAGKESVSRESKTFQRIRETHVQRAYSLEWMKLQLEGVGFAAVELYADFAFEPVNEKSERVFFVCKKGSE